MKKYSRILVTFGLGLGIFFQMPQTYSLPAVESRNGDPVIRYQNNAPRYSGQNSGRNSGQHYGNKSNNQNAEYITAEDRAITSTISQIEQLQREVSELRGMLEIQENEMKLMKKSQQDLYMDLDRRMNKIQVKAPVNTIKKPESAASTHKKEKVAVVSTENKKENIISDTSATSTKENINSDIPGNNTVAALPSMPAMPSGVRVNPAPAPIHHEEGGGGGGGSHTTTIHTSPATTTPSHPSSSPSSPGSSSSGKEGSKLLYNPASNPGDEPIIEKKKHNPKKNENESLLYQGAYNMVKNKRYEEAVKAFKEYLEEFPQGEYAANAHYWLGEVQMVQWQSDKKNQSLLANAEKEFSTLNANHPNHTKTADAILKMGMIELEKNNKDAAKNYFMQVKTRYPGTTAARIAETRLQEIS